MLFVRIAVACFAECVAVPSYDTTLEGTQILSFPEPPGQRLRHTITMEVPVESFRLPQRNKKPEVLHR